MSTLTPEQIAIVAAHPKVKTVLTPENFDKKLAERIWDMLECLIRELGVEADPQGDSKNTCSMTDATEFYWGTSGRGSPMAKNKIQAAANLGYLTHAQKGRNTRIGISARGYALWLQLRDERGATEPVKS